MLFNLLKDTGIALTNLGMVQLDEDSIARQKLYEKWVTKEKWSLHESICLMTGNDPGSSKRKAEYAVFEQSMIDAVEQGTLESLTSVSGTDADYEFEPQKVFTWARMSGIELPVELVNLMEFVIKTIAFTPDEEPEQVENLASKDAENILGACVAVLASFPEECTNQKGKVSTERLLKLMGKHSDSLFPDSLPGLSSTAIRDLVNNWVVKLRN